MTWLALASVVIGGVWWMLTPSSPRRRAPGAPRAWSRRWWWRLRGWCWRMIVVVSDEAVGPDVGGDQPWGRYRRARLASGWTYVLGRDAIEGGLREAGARVDSLSMHLPFHFSSGPGLDVVEVSCSSDSGSGLSGPRVFPDRVVMWWSAVPGRGNAWSASNHRWALRYEAERGLYVVEK